MCFARVFATLGLVVVVEVLPLTTKTIIFVGSYSKALSSNYR